MPSDLPSPPAVAVIGGGPAGLAAAEVLARGGAAVTVYERMPTVGRKFLMAGRGGLNLTHSEEVERFRTRYGAAAERLGAALEAHAPADLRAWADALGAETFVGSSGRVFPKALKASPLLRAWLARLGEAGVAIRTRHRWTGWDEAGRLVVEGPGGETLTPSPAATVLALGGGSWPRLGSDGAWTAPLTARGVAITPLRPSNCGFEVPWSEVFRTRFEGAPVKRIALAFEGRSVRGEALVTRHGIEGGAVYALSGPLRDAIAARGEARPTLDLRPDLSLEALASRLAAPRRGQSASSFLRKQAALPPVGIGLLREAAGRDLPTDPGALAALIKAVPLTLTAPRPIEWAISTAGGIALDEVDEHFMLRRLPGVFVAGEMLDWEAPTGGYLLQATFATGIRAARGCLAWLEERVPQATPGK